jgi:hypothetical protein
VQHWFQLPSIYGQEISTSYVEPCDNFDTPEFQETIVRGKHAYGWKSAHYNKGKLFFFCKGLDAIQKAHLGKDGTPT